MAVARFGLLTGHGQPAQVGCSCRLAEFLEASCPGAGGTAVNACWSQHADETARWCRITAGATTNMFSCFAPALA